MSAPRPSTRSLSALDLGSLLFLGAVWGAAILFLRIAAAEVGPVWAAEGRVAIGAAALVAVAGRRTLRVARGRLIAFLIVGGTFAALPFMLISYATLTLPIGVAAVLNASTPLFTALLGVLVLHQRLAPRVLVGLGVGVAAVVVLVGWSPLEPGPVTVLAVAAALGAPASYAVAGTYVRARLSGVGGLELATGMLVAAALVALPVALLLGPTGAPSAAGIASLLGAGVVSTAVAWPVFFRLLARTSPTVASTATFIVPAFAMVWGALVLAEPVGAELVTGFGLVLVSLALVLGIRVPFPAPFARVTSRAAGALRGGSPA